MLGIIDRIGNFTKSLASPATGSVPFSGFGGSGYGLPYGVAGASWGTMGNSPGAKFDYQAAAGDMAQNVVVAACVRAISEAMALAPLRLEERRGDKWAELVDAEPIHLLHNPNSAYGAYDLWAATNVKEVVNGSGYWRIVFDKLGRKPESIWFEPVAQMEWRSGFRFIERYYVLVDGKRYPVDAAANFPEDKYQGRDLMIHFRYALDPNNPRMGWTPLFTAMRQVAGDNTAATFHAAIMRNGAVGSKFLSSRRLPPDVTYPTPDQMDDIGQKLVQKLSGEGAGKVAWSNLPIEVNDMTYSPDQMGVPQLVSYYESRICLALEVPPMILSLSAGNATKTYSNLAEAIHDFWTRCIIPRQERHANALRSQYLPLWGLNPENYRFSYNYDDVKALQEDVDEKYERLENACGGPFLTPNEARSRIKLEVLTDPAANQLRTSGTTPPNAGFGRAVDDATVKTLVGSSIKKRPEIDREAAIDYPNGIRAKQPVVNIRNGKESGELLAKQIKAFFRATPADIDAPTNGHTNEPTGKLTYKSETQQFIDAEEKAVTRDAEKAASEAVIKYSQSNMMEVAGKLRIGKVEPDEFIDAMEQEVINLHAGQYALARGGFDLMSDADWNKVASIASKQINGDPGNFPGLRGFEKDLNAGKYDVEDDGGFSDGVVARASLYAGAGRATYENTRFSIARDELEHERAKNLLAGVEHHCDECPALAADGWMDIDEMPEVGDRECSLGCECVIITAKAGNEYDLQGDDE